MQDINIDTGSLVAERFRIKNLIGKGTFGQVYSAVDILNNKEVAVKVEIKSGKRSQIGNEAKILQELQGTRGFPKFICSGKHNDLSLIAMELLGTSIRSKFVQHNKVFSLQTIVLIGEQMLERIKCLHDHNYIHRDIKPQQFVTSLREKENLIYLIDYGLSKKYLNDLGFHTPYTENRPFAGTYHYASINSQCGIQQGRRDDLESMCYSIAYLFRGELPWITSAHQKISSARIRQIKAKTSPLKLLQGAPYEFCEMMCYVKSLQFDAKPDYDYLKELFSAVKRKESITSSYFD